ncbi:hypothetical protein PR002_g31455 [Phytophthora rubi]|uniref:Uncharacterized protein n=1 Tax=Phytophthora rubi TaxID=129364 RepID=A0A6A3GDH2_9STRA|nr:hypothetical protein PR002_g31455 [Phytophthora rubi]
MERSVLLGRRAEEAARSTTAAERHIRPSARSDALG